MKIIEQRFVYIQIYDRHDENNVDQNLIIFDVVFEKYLDLIDLLIFHEMEEIRHDRSCYFYKLQNFDLN
jgi:hypothetical protein